MINKHSHCNGKAVVYENFLTEEQCDTLYKFMDTYDYEKLDSYMFAKYFEKRQLSKKQLALQPKYKNDLDPIQPILDDIINKMYELLNSEGDTKEWIAGEPVLMRIFKDGIPEDHPGNRNEGMFLHVDDQPWMEGKVIWGTVIYLNNDYVGGELYYPEYDHYYKPKRKDLVMHAGDIVHGVTEVTSGTRYAVTITLRIKGEYNNNPLPVKEYGMGDGFYYYPPGYWGKRMPDDPTPGDVKNPRSDGTFAPYNDNPTAYVPKI